MHGEQASGVINWEFPGRTGFDMEMSCAGGFFVKEVYRRGGRVFWLGQRMCGYRPADQLHVHSSDGASWWEPSHSF